MEKVATRRFEAWREEGAWKARVEVEDVSRRRVVVPAMKRMVVVNFTGGG